MGGSNNPMLWVGYPRSYSPGRARAVQFVTIHYTAGSEGPTSAEGGASYDKTRTDGTSCHAFFDSAGPGLQELPFSDRCHSAMYHGNEIGVHFEICGTIQSRAQWLDSTSMATLKTCAEAVYYTCETLGLELRRLSAAETRAAYYAPAGQRPTGINDHGAITAAFPEDSGSHTDVGPEFPWDVFMDLVLSHGSAEPTTEEDDVSVKLIAPTDGYGEGGVYRLFPTDLGMALEKLVGGQTQLEEAVSLYGQEKYVVDALAHGTPIEDLIAKWVSMGGTSSAGGPVVFPTYNITGSATPKA